MAALSSTAAVPTSTTAASSAIKVKSNSFPYTRFYHCPFSLRSPASLTALYPGRCRAANPGPPPTPQTDSHTEDDPRQLTTGLAASFSRIQDRVQIFFAVLFWMSLFFWASAWDGKNRPNKGSKFRR